MNNCNIQRPIYAPTYTCYGPTGPTGPTGP